MRTCYFERKIGTKLTIDYNILVVSLAYLINLLKENDNVRKFSKTIKSLKKSLFSIFH